MPAMTLLGVALLLLILHQLAWAAVRLVLALAARWAAPLAASRSYVRDHPINAWAGARFPRSHAFLKARFDSTEFTGLPLTLIAVAAFYLAALFGGLVDELFEAEGLARVDDEADRLVGYLRGDAGFRVFLWLTDLGAGPTFVAVGLVATTFLVIENRLAYVPAMWTTLLGAQTTTWIGKYAIARTRPEFLDVAAAVAPSFPSGHATAAMAVYGFLAYVVVRRVGSRRVRFEVIYWTAMLIALIGFSRIYLRVHFLSDVLSGFLVGGFWLLVGVAVAEWLRAARQR
ncbi:MAG TPA: phosphatase PAP2 family protein [Alphaproteobacteria bacterium]|nr:phosphatase PAP2 family protein [Alphaproteobacteria bacterium]